jgi:SecD-like export protein
VSWRPFALLGFGARHAVLPCAPAIATIFWIAAVAAEPLLFDIARAELAYDQRTGEPIVSFRFTPASGQKFAEFTARNVGRMTELRVDGKVLSRIVIREPILQGSGQISGHFSVQEAQDLAAHLTAGTQLEIEAVAN